MFGRFGGILRSVKVICNAERAVIDFVSILGSFAFIALWTSSPHLLSCKVMMGMLVIMMVGTKWWKWRANKNLWQSRRREQRQLQQRRWWSGSRGWRGQRSPPRSDCPALKIKVKTEEKICKIKPQKGAVSASLLHHPNVIPTSRAHLLRNFKDKLRKNLFKAQQ